MAAMTEPIPAATLILFREGLGQPDILMVERAAAMSFAGGAMVFPGGRVDPGDAVLAQAIAPALLDGAARIAAIRETLEETGIAIGFGDRPHPDAVAAMRAALHDGAPMATVLGDHLLDLELLVPFAHWLPKHVEWKIFDTRFYIARAPDDAGEVVVDAGETVSARWVRAADMLAAADRDEARIIFPTRRNLERLAQFESYEQALTDARRYHPPPVITPFAEERDGVPHLCIPEGAGYPVTAEPMDRAARG